MARSLMSTIAAAQRDANRARAARARAQVAATRNAERAQAAAAREAARTRAAYERAAKADVKERARLYTEARLAEVAEANSAIEQTISDLSSILATGLATDSHIDFETLKVRPALPEWGHRHLEVPEAVPDPSRYVPDPPTGLGKVFGGKQHAATVAAMRAEYDQACAQHQLRDQQRQTALRRARLEFDKATKAAQSVARNQHAEVDRFKLEFDQGETSAILDYLETALSASTYPVGFPNSFRLAYVPVSRQLVVEFEFPAVDVIPTVKTSRYVKAQDAVVSTARPASQIRSLYSEVLAQTTLRVLHEAFAADRGKFIDVVVFNGMLSTTHPATGQQVRPCLITVRATRDSFRELDLALVDPAACLRHLSASVSRSPAELEAVRPVLEFSMVDERFVDETDVLSGLDQRPNLMELSPTEFEGLIQNLFAKMGLDTKQTRPSRDGGVDCVAYDPRPVLGGKVVIQAKRYKNTVGVSAVRDLYGTMLNEGASKGILVTTSGYGRGSYDFAKDKPLELLDGANLLALLADHAGIEAKIIAPDTWTDPQPDERHPAEPTRTEPRAAQPVAAPPQVQDQAQTAHALAARASGYRCANPKCSNLGGPVPSNRQCPVCFHRAPIT